MLKKILGILAALGMLAYLIFAIVQFSDVPGAQKCREVVIQVMDSTDRSYVNVPEVRQLMKLNNLGLIGQRLDEIRYRRIEFVVSVMRMVRRVECFATNSGKVIVRVWQHSPVLRVMQEQGNFYVDASGQRLEISFNSAANVLVASGSIRDTVHVRRLYRMAMLLRQDPFWDAQIVQVYVEPNGEWILIPRVGGYEIEFGLPNDVEDKLTRLKLFYQKALPRAGWEKYSSINVKYKKQIICTKKVD
ncbi:MAG: cell division protein FtsQ/DivIB [Bacteroidia bacterium]|nr:cell division protein FtsQ/DivIB [Bacteroidia bacterium]